MAIPTIKRNPWFSGIIFLSGLALWNVQIKKWSLIAYFPLRIHATDNYMWIISFEFLLLFEGRSIDRQSHGHQRILTKMDNFLEMFEKNAEKVFLLPPNMIICQLNIKDYAYDDGVPMFCYCKNIEAYLICNFWKLASNML